MRPPHQVRHQTWRGTPILRLRGKVDNGIVTVHPASAKARYKGLLDGRTYCPEGRRPQRCSEAISWSGMGYRPKWQIALEELDRPAQWHRFTG
jgi:hypothetical protein